MRALQIPVLRESPETKASISSATKPPQTTDGALHFPFWVVGSGGGGVALLGGCGGSFGRVSDYRVVFDIIFDVFFLFGVLFLSWVVL